VISTSFVSRCGEAALGGTYRCGEDNQSLWEAAGGVVTAAQEQEGFGQGWGEGQEQGAGAGCQVNRVSEWSHLGVGMEEAGGF